MEFTSAQLTSIIIAVISSTISLIGAVISAILIYKAAIRTPPKGEPKPSLVEKKEGQDKKSFKRFKKTYTILLIIFLVGSVPGINIIRKDYYTPYISIIDPQSGQKVDGTIEVKGTYRNIDENKLAIWIVVYSYKDHLFFIQRMRADMVLEDQVWNNKETIIGTNSDNGAKFDIMVLLVDKKSQAYGEIKKYLTNINAQGLSALPEEIQLMKEITIYRK